MTVATRPATSRGAMFWRCSSWGRRGVDDEAGTLNLTTNQVVRQARHHSGTLTASGSAWLPARPRWLRRHAE
ncbi:hypothetical protein GCM10023321_39460 [Pseudonocardia eucalypti]|uniref:Uncharacterized protein n=1 Tax=Pseudonocardia eucalypti TaxID=648755 RepID=A0ABP9Q9D7_9PSEU|nr:hypothetical protein [Pseudonocardia eucalypti]